MQAHLVGPQEDERAVAREGKICIVDFARVREGEEAVEAVAGEEATGGDAGEVPVEGEGRRELSVKGNQIKIKHKAQNN